MVSVVNQTEEAGSFDKAWDKRIDSFNKYMNLNPAFYGLQKLGEKAGLNISDGMSKYVFK